MTDLTRREEHFEFGANWADFARTIDEARIANAESCLRDLIGGDLAAQSFLDIGCGSGLSALAALRLGAVRVRAVDLDENSVATAQALLRFHAPGADSTVIRRSVFDLAPATDGTYDMVYSWGVLHHTGAMWDAIAKAAALVTERGRLVIAIYRRTPLCGFWRWEKRLYSHGPAWLAAAIRALYKSAFLAALVATGRNPVRYVRKYGRTRGMRWSNDVHDWLGGYPYESASPQEIDARMTALGFRREHAVLRDSGYGIFGSGCDEYIYRRI